MDSQSDSAEDALVTVGAGAQAEPVDAADEWAAAQAAQARRVTPLRADLSQDVAVDEPTDDGRDEVVTDGPVDRSTEPADQFAEPVEYEQPAWIGPEQPQDDMVDGSRSVRASSIPDEIDEDEWTAHAAAAPAPTFADVDDEHLRPVPHRPGRGGFDPEAAEATRAYRYQQRRRVTLILLVATVAFTVAALVLINWLWFGAAISLALLVGYLAYLRRQVRIEAAIRQKRMERLQRSRQIRPEYRRPPQRVRAGMSAVAPGRTMVDLDDDDPGFDDLEEFQEPMTYRRAAGQ